MVDARKFVQQTARRAVSLGPWRKHVDPQAGEPYGRGHDEDDRLHGRPAALSQVSWQADYRDSAGVRRHRQFLTQRKAKEFLAQTTVEVAEGRHVAESQSRTVAEAAAVWFERCRNGDPTGEPGPLEASTVAVYDLHVGYLTDPDIGIGAIKLTRLMRGDVDAFLTRLREHPNQRRSAETVRQVRSSLSTLLGVAQHHGWPATSCARISDVAATAATSDMKS